MEFQVNHFYCARRQDTHKVDLFSFIVGDFTYRTKFVSAMVFYGCKSYETLSSFFSSSQQQMNDQSFVCNQCNLTESFSLKTALLRLISVDLFVSLKRIHIYANKSFVYLNGNTIVVVVLSRSKMAIFVCNIIFFQTQDTSLHD